MKKLESITNDLNLVDYGQDWGIINSDKDRVLEFIEYFDSKNILLHKEICYDFFELIIASYNDYLVSEKKMALVDDKMKLFIEQHKNEDIFFFVKNYWVGIKNESEFPIGYML